MTNIYRPLSARAKAINGEDDFEADLTAVDELDQIRSGHLAIVPRAYEILSNNYEAGAQGDVVDLALLVDSEAALITGGHLKRLDITPGEDLGSLLKPDLVAKAEELELDISGTKAELIARIEARLVELADQQ